MKFRQAKVHSRADKFKIHFCTPGYRGFARGIKNSLR